jgi:hypothetical protein
VNNLYNYVINLENLIKFTHGSNNLIQACFLLNYVTKIIHILFTHEKKGKFHQGVKNQSGTQKSRPRLRFLTSTWDFPSSELEIKFFKY